jgi:signal transduction histidine kinase
MEQFNSWKNSVSKQSAHHLSQTYDRLVKFHKTLKQPLAQYMVILTALFCSFMIVSLTVSYEYSWHRLRLPTEYNSGTFSLSPSTTEVPINFQGMLKSCDRIISFGDLTSTQFIEPDKVQSNNSRVILVSTLEDTFDFPITKPLHDGQIVQIWSTKSNWLTVDTSNCKNPIGNINNLEAANLNFCQGCFTQPQPNQLQINLTELKIQNGEFISITLLSLICLSFCALGLLFFLFQPNRIITVVHCLFFNTVGLALVAHNSTYYHTGGLERVVSITTFQLIPPLFVHFVLLFPDGTHLAKSASRFVKFSYFSSFIVLIFELYANLVPDSNGNIPFWEATFHKLRYLEFGLLFATGIIILISKFIKSKHQHRLRLKLAVLSLLVGILPVFAVFVFNSFFGLLQDWTENYFAFLLIPAVLIPGGFGYAVVKNNLLGVDLKVRRIVVRTILISLVTFLYLTLTPLISFFFSFWSGIENNPVFQVLLIIALNELCNRFRNILNQFIDRTFAVDPLNYNDLARKWSTTLARTTELNKTFTNVITQLPQDYHYKKSALLFFQPQLIQIQLKTLYSRVGSDLSSSNTLMVSSYQGQKDIDNHGPIPSNSRLNYSFLEINTTVIDYLQHEEWILFGHSKLPSFVASELADLKFETNVVIPLKLGNEFYGALLLGEKTGEFTPPPNELDFLSNIATQISASIHNSLLLTEAKAIAEKEKTIRLMSEARTRRDQQVRQKTLSEVADDLHGGPLQDLFYLQQGLEQVSKDVDAGLPLNNYDFSVYAYSVREVISKVRRTTTALRLYGVEKDFINGIKRLIKDFGSTHGTVDILFTVNTTLPVDEILPEQIKFALFRAIQEALNNAFKHSQASKVEILFELDLIQMHPSDSKIVTSEIPNPSDFASNYLVEVRISDNGKGVDEKLLDEFNSETSPEQEYEQLEKGDHLGIGIIKQQITQFSEIYQSEINFYSSNKNGFEVAIALHIPAETVTVAFDKPVPFELSV